jgi:DNA-binding LacI/PurR family transcriptional regulator
LTLQQVAKLAGVSASTVSRVINARTNVKTGTAETVRKAMQELQFKPARRRVDRSVGGRVTDRKTHIAMLILGSSDRNSIPPHEALLRGASAVCDRTGIQLSLRIAPDADAAIASIDRHSINGVLIHGQRPNRVPSFIQQQLPTVWLMANRLRPNFGDQVMPDGTGIGQLAAQYLLRKGHRHAAYFGLNTNWSFGVRCLSFREVIEAAGGTAIELTRGNLDTEHYWTLRGGESAIEALVQELVELPTRPTALFVAEDWILPFLYSALARRGISAGPGCDIDIVSCNNQTVHFMGLPNRPPTIDIRIEAIGRYGVEQLLWRIRNGLDAPRIRMMVEPALVDHSADGHTDSH